LSNASYESLGSWPPQFKIQWQHTKQDLIDVGFNIKIINVIMREPDPEQQELHGVEIIVRESEKMQKDRRWQQGVFFFNNSKESDA
jgi:hypothetical protein